MVQIAGDGGLLRYGIARSSVVLGPGERTEVVIDFGSPFAVSSHTLTNLAPAPYPNGEEQYAVTNVLRFNVSAESGPRSHLSLDLRKEQRELDPAQAIRTRDFSLQRSTDGCDGGSWLINGLRYHDVTERPHLDTTEIWRFINRSGATHTMHMHLEMFEVLDRQSFTIQGDDVIPKGTPAPPDPGETGWKDTVLVRPLEMVRVVTRFEDFLGPYPYHCHMLEHEDHDMMRQFVTQPPCPDAGCPPEDDGGATCDGSADNCAVAGVAAANSGCACAVDGGAPSSGPSLLALALAVFGAGGWRRRRPARPRRWVALLGALALAQVASCGSTTTDPRDADVGEAPANAADQAGSKLPFGASCAAHDDCETDVCAAFGDGTMHCTEACTDATTCPSGSQGQKCNGKGFCAF
jgi:MYXO-CTERM domain-containing protein